MQRIILSDAQRAVLEHPIDHPGVVEAGAGTGKTFTIVERVVALHESGRCPASHILLLTFGRKAASELRARVARRLGEAAPDCQTFHSFAWNVLLANFYEVGLSPDTAVIEDADARVEFRKAFEDFLQDAKAPDAGFPLRTYNQQELRDSLFVLRQELKQRGIGVDDFRDRALAAAERFGHVAFREIRQQYAKKAGFKRIAQVSDEQLAQQTQEEKRRVVAVADIFARFDARLSARNALTYADILIRAENAIRKNDQLRSELRERYHCCIVDEYQDTDLAQHRFLEALFGRDLQGVMVVGDELQSIYSFRGAQPENVKKLKEAPNARRYPLFENRRSLQEILDLAHHAVLPAHTDAQRLRGERGAAGEQIIHVSSLWSQTPGSGEYIPFDQARVLEAGAVAKRIRHLLASKTLVETGSTTEPIAPRHIAILSRTKTNVQPVTQALLEAGINFRLVGGVGFYDAPEIRDVLAWLRLLADPFEGHAVARALGSPIIGASDALLAHLARGLTRDETALARRVLVEQNDGDSELDCQAREACTRLRNLLDELAPHAALPLLGALHAVLDATQAQQFYRASSDPRAAQALANLAKFEALARGFARENPGAQPADFVDFINELERIDFDEREADVPSYDAVTISTIHAAKGLEWPIVFVLGVWPQLQPKARLFVGNDGSLLYGESVDGSRPFHYLAVRRNADAQGWVPRDDEADDDREDKAEECRLFYVALTRARDRVFISGPRRKPSKTSPLGRPHAFLERVYGWLEKHHMLGDEKIADVVAVALPRPAGVGLASAKAMPTIDVAPNGETSLAVPLSYSMIAEYAQCPRRATYRLILGVPGVGGSVRWARARQDEARDQADLAAQDSLLGSSDYGAVVHKAIELWAIARRSGQLVPSAASLVNAASAALSLTPASSQHDEAVRAMEHVMTRLESWTPLYIEAPFTLDFGDEGRPLLVNGYLDLLAMDESGKPCLVDYKTGDARESKFALQLALYRTAAREVYGVNAATCFIGRVKDDGFVLESITPVNDDVLRHSVVGVRDGLIARDTQPKAGSWCDTCGYRDAPCQDYKRPKRG